MNHFPSTMSGTVVNTGEADGKVVSHFIILRAREVNQIHFPS